jgi:hypothetical protein
MSAIYLFLGREGGFFLSSSMVEKPGTFPLTAPSLYQPFQKYFLPPYPEISELNFIASLIRIQPNGQNWKDIIISVLVRVTPSGNQLFDFLRARRKNVENTCIAIGSPPERYFEITGCQHI